MKNLNKLVPEINKNFNERFIYHPTKAGENKTVIVKINIELWF